MVVDFRLLRGVRVNGSATNGSGSSNSSSVYHALLEKRGCTVNVDELQSENGANNGERNKSSSSNDNRHEEKSRTSDINNAVKKKLKGFSFSSVLLDALDNSSATGTSTNNDGDTNQDGDAMKKKKRAPLSGPLSGPLQDRHF